MTIVTRISRWTLSGKLGYLLALSGEMGPQHIDYWRLTDLRLARR